MLKYPLWKGFIFIFIFYFIYLSIYLLIYLFTYLFIYLFFIYLFIYFFFLGGGSLGINIIVKHADRRNLCRVIV